MRKSTGKTDTDTILPNPPPAYFHTPYTMQKALGRVLSTWELSSIFSTEKLEEIRDFMRKGVRQQQQHPPTAQPSPPVPQTLSHTQQRPHIPMMSVPTVSLPDRGVGLPVQQQQHLPPPPPPVTAAITSPVGPDVGALVNARMKQLLDQQMQELGQVARMSVDDLWRTNAELAQEFRIVAEAQINEELSPGGTQPPPVVVSTAPTAAAPASTPLQPPPPPMVVALPQPPPPALLPASVPLALPLPP
ncbi:unnamed protein product, partial [Choristocarpus tenellus]